MGLWLIKKETEPNRTESLLLNSVLGIIDIVTLVGFVFALWPCFIYIYPVTLGYLRCCTPCFKYLGTNTHLCRIELACRIFAEAACNLRSEEMPG